MEKSKKISRNRTIYILLSIAALLSLLLPTVIFTTPVGRWSFSFSNIVGVNMWFVVFWAVALILPFVIILLNCFVSKKNSRLNMILFAIAALFIFVVYPVATQLMFMNGANFGGGMQSLFNGTNNADMIAGDIGANMAGGIGAQPMGMNGVSFRIGIGTILSGTCLLLGLAIATIGLLKEKREKRQLAVCEAMQETAPKQDTTPKQEVLPDNQSVEPTEHIENKEIKSDNSNP